MDSEKRVWLVTGSSTGLGAALCMNILQSGQTLIATARNPSALSFLPHSNNLLMLPLEVTSPSSIATALSSGIERFGRIDYVVSNAGYGIFAEAEGTDEAEARGMMETNFWGSANVALEAVKVFRRQEGGGTLVQISSMLGRVGAGGQSYYCASKYAIEGFMAGLAKELPSEWGIKIIIAEPGGIKGTAFNRNILKERAIHEAYRDPDFPTNKVRDWLKKPDLEEAFPSADEIARVLLDVVIGGKFPLRLPLGSDSWEGIYGEMKGEIEILEGWRAVSERPGVKS